MRLALGLMVLALSWQNAANSNYTVIERERGPQKWSVIQVLQTPAQSYVDQGAQRGWRYCYRLRALNAYGSSVSSNILCAKAR